MYRHTLHIYESSDNRTPPPKGKFLLQKGSPQGAKIAIFRYLGQKNDDQNGTRGGVTSPLVLARGSPMAFLIGGELRVSKTPSASPCIGVLT